MFGHCFYTLCSRNHSSGKELDQSPRLNEHLGCRLEARSGRRCPLLRRGCHDRRKGFAKAGDAARNMRTYQSSTAESRMKRPPIVFLGKAPQCVVRFAAFSIGDQCPNSDRRAKLAGVLSCLAGLDPPKSANRFLNEGSFDRAWNGDGWRQRRGLSMLAVWSNPVWRLF